VLGLLLGFAIVAIVEVAVPGLPVRLSWLYIGLALLIALGIGVLAGILPARHAAELAPLDALRTE
jgi:putative ABC transport system permease protein